MLLNLLATNQKTRECRLKNQVDLCESDRFSNNTLSQLKSFNEHASATSSDH